MFWNVYCELCAKENLSPNAAAKEIGISSGAITQWKRGIIPRIGSIHKIADYFGVPVEYLLKEDQQEATVPTQKDELYVMDPQRVHMVPVFENVSAGFGVCAIDHVVDYIPAYIANPHDAANTICVKVRGDSMSPRIEDGDLIQVLKQSDADSGMVVVAMVDSEDFFVKRFFQGDNWIELRSDNPMYKPMRFNGTDALRVRVVGVVKKVIKDM